MSIMAIVAVALLAASPLAVPAQSPEAKSTVREFVAVSGTVERIALTGTQAVDGGDLVLVLS